MNSPFADVPAFTEMPPAPPTGSNLTGAPLSSPNSFPNIPVHPLDDGHRIRGTPVSLEDLSDRLGLRPPGQPTNSPSRSVLEQLDTDANSGDALLCALMNGLTTSSSDADFIINICNQDDLLTTDQVLVSQYKAKGIPRSTSALLDVLEDNKTFKKIRIAFETQLKTICGPPLTNAVNKFIGDIVSLLHPSARTTLRMVVLIMAQFRGIDNRASPAHNLSSRIVHFWKIFVWTHEDDLVSVLDTLSTRRDPPVTIPNNVPYQQAPGYLRLNSEFYATPTSVALVTKVMLLYTIKPTVQNLDPAHLRDRLLIQKRSGHPKIMTNNDAETWIMDSKDELNNLIEVATITGDRELIPTIHELSTNYRSAASAPIFKIMKEWAALKRIELARLDLNSIEAWMLAAQSILELNTENDRARAKVGKDLNITAPAPAPADGTQQRDGKGKGKNKPKTTPAAPDDTVTTAVTPAPAAAQPANSSAAGNKKLHPVTNEPLDPKNPEDLRIIRQDLPCRAEMNNDAGCNRTAEVCRYSHDPAIIAAYKANKKTVHVTAGEHTTPAVAAIPAAASTPAPVYAPAPPPPPPPPPSTTSHINSNQYNCLYADSDDSDDSDFALERISKPTSFDTRTIHMITRSPADPEDDSFMQMMHCDESIIDSPTTSEDKLDVSVGQFEFDARRAAREGRPEAQRLIESGAVILPNGAIRNNRTTTTSAWQEPPWQPENIQAYRLADVGNEVDAALNDSDLAHDNSVDLSTMEDEELQLQMAIDDPTNRTITQFFQPAQPLASPIGFESTDESDETDRSLMSLNDSHDDIPLSQWHLQRVHSTLTNVSNTTAVEPHNEHIGHISEYMEYPTSTNDDMSYLCYCKHGSFPGQCQVCKQCTICCTVCIECEVCATGCQCDTENQQNFR